MNKKVRIILLSVIAFLILTLTTTYGLWYVTKNQTNENIISTKCLDISLTNEENDITLTEAYPITDEDGMNLTPYTFSVKNNCNTSIDYQLNLELLGDSETSVDASAIKLSLNDKTPVLLNEKFYDDVTLENAYASYLITYGALEAQQSQNYSLRIWVDEEAQVSESNKVFESKMVVKAGQGIEDPIKKGSLAYDIISNYGGIEAITSLSYDWREEKSEETTTIYRNDSVYYYWGTDYEFIDGVGYKLSGEIIKSHSNACKYGTKSCGKYTVFGDTESAISERLYIVNSFGVGGNINVQHLTYKNNFSYPSTNDYAKIHKANDDLGISYYFKGNVKNNYVKFGKHLDNGDVVGFLEDDSVTNYKVYQSLEECNAASRYKYNCSYLYEQGEDMYWRIVRINGDGTIRLIYDGTEAVANAPTINFSKFHIDNIGESAYNPNYSDTSAEYTYEKNGIQVDSEIKSYLDSWYEKNLKIYDKYIADGIFCNDTEKTSASYNVPYLSYDRLVNNKTPKLTCTQDSDKYTANTEYGNGYLTYPIGLITADEVAMAGGVQGMSNTSIYLYSSKGYWTATPCYFSYPYKQMFMVSNIGSLSYVYGTASSLAVRPVINLKADVVFTGEGTMDNPYEIVIN